MLETRNVQIDQFNVKDLGLFCIIAISRNMPTGDNYIDGNSRKTSKSSVFDEG